MAGQVILTVHGGQLDGQRYVFDKPTRCMAGRAADCALHIPSEPWYADVSRRHCLFEIAPPVIRVDDLGSRNGTYVNSQRIAQGEHELHDGDEVRLGGVLIRVHIATVEDHPAVPIEQPTLAGGMSASVA